MAQIEKN